MERWLDIRSFWRGLLPAVVAIGLAVLVVGIEDFGTAALLAAVGGAMLLMAGARWWHLMLLVLPAVPAFGYLLVSRSHRMERILTFMDIWRDQDGKGYQAIQSLCTIASGGWWGRGAGQGFSKTYLPEARTDFIFAVIYEEWGMLGAVAVVGLFLAMLWLAGWVICRCQDPFGRLLVFGLALMIGMQAAINVAVVTVMAPTKGIALPMVSAGGSGAIVLGAIVGLMASVAWRCGSCRDSQQKSE
jgi:cell division protein FtsW